MAGATEAALRRPIALAGAAAAVTAVAFAIILSAGVDNSLEVWLVKDNASYADYARFVEAFGSEEFILAAVHGEGILEPDGLNVLRAAAERAASVQGVRAVFSPTAVLDQLGATDESGGKILRAAPAYEGLLVSAGGRTAGMYLTIDPAAAARPEIVAGIRDALAFVQNAGFELRLGGPPVLNAELDALSNRDPRVLFPIVFAVTIILLAVLFRSVAGVAVPMACLVVTVFAALAAVTLLGGRLNMITVGFPTVLWVLGISQAVHLVAAYRRLAAEGQGDRAAFGAAKEIRYPCLLMAVTTAVGFLSLLFSSVAPVRELGLYTAGGILFGFVVNIVLGPALLVLAERFRLHAPKPAAAQASGGQAFYGLVRWTLRRKAVVLGAAVVLVGLSAAAATRIRVETNALSFLRSDNPLLDDYAFIQKNLTGLAAIEVDVERSGDSPLADTIAAIREFTRRLEASDREARGSPEAKWCRVLSIDDYIKAAAFHLAVGPEQARTMPLDELAQRAAAAAGQVGPAAAALLLPVVRARTDLSRYITADNRRLRVSVFTSEFETEEFGRRRRQVERAAAEAFGGAARVTGIVPLLVEMQEHLFASQTRCLGAALAVILLFMALAARSLVLGIVCMAPNVFPVALNFGAMGLLGVKLDAATMMIASVAVGIAVDNTIHVIVAYRERRGGGLSRTAALEAAVASKGRPIVYTALVTGLGFAVLAFSGFVPMAWFGALTAATIFWAMLGDLFILPALLGLKTEDRA